MFELSSKQLTLCLVDEGLIYIILFFFLKPMDVTMASVANSTVRKSAGYSTPGGNVTMSGVDSPHFSPQRGGHLTSPTQIDPFYTQG